MLTRTRAWLLLATMSIGLAACGSSAATQSPSASAPPPSATAQATPAPTAEPSAAAPAASPVTNVTIYRVKKGDTLTVIAKRYKIRLAALIAANPQLADPDKLKIGQRINIPAPGSPTPTPS